MFWGSVSFFAAYLIATHGVSVGFVALPLAITAVGQAAASFCVGYVVKNRHRAAIITGASLIGSIGGLLTFSANLGLWPAVAAATVGSAMVRLNIATLIAMSTAVSGESKATGAAIVGLSNQLGGMFGAAAGQCRISWHRVHMPGRHSRERADDGGCWQAVCGGCWIIIPESVSGRSSAEGGQCGYMGDIERDDEVLPCMDNT